MDILILGFWWKQKKNIYIYRAKILETCGVMCVGVTSITNSNILLLIYRLTTRQCQIQTENQRVEIEQRFTAIERFTTVPYF